MSSDLKRCKSKKKQLKPELRLVKAANLYFFVFQPHKEIPLRGFAGALKLHYCSSLIVIVPFPFMGVLYHREEVKFPQTKYFILHDIL